MTLNELARATGYSVSTINGLELNGEGSERLKKRLLEVLPYSPQNTDSVISGIAMKESQVEYKTKADWQQRALTAEKKLQAIRNILEM
jgi:transcriptional regulator with XRE-family HTH domain